jgi:hypothetical protein
MKTILLFLALALAVCSLVLFAHGPSIPPDPWAGCFPIEACCGQPGYPACKATMHLRKGR